MRARCRPPSATRELTGYVVGSFRMHDLMRGILDEGVLQVLDMRVFDSSDARLDSELIDTRNAWRVTPSLNAARPSRAR